MKILVFLFTAGILLLSAGGCRCGCQSNSVQTNRDFTAAYQDRQTLSAPAVSSEIDVQVDYGNSF